MKTKLEKRIYALIKHRAMKQSTVVKKLCHCKKELIVDAIYYMMDRGELRLDNWVLHIRK